MDTTVSDATQGMWPAIGGPAKNVFKAKDESLNSTGTYYTFLLFATTATHQTYSLYVGPGFNSDPNTGDLYAVQVDVSSSPLVPTKKGAIKWPWPKPEYKDGILTVTMDMNFGDFQNNYNNAVNNKCKPETFCSSSGSTCSCALDQSNELYRSARQFAVPGRKKTSLVPRVAATVLPFICRMVSRQTARVLHRQLLCATRTTATGTFRSIPRTRT